MKKSIEFGLRYCVSEKGQIYVNDHLQVVNFNPIGSKLNNMNNSIQSFSYIEAEDNKLLTPKIYNNMFCFGDACLTHLDEEKSIYPIRECAKIVAYNIKTMVTEGKEQILKIIPLQRF
jgi:hypothetical protein